ncbi:thiamine-phosphate kinase [Dongia sp.]|uniref:thiamine-phosphate kinase n=1 Tax=Dongia sp. TaxID=1977262 RepID=UPI0035B37E65
MARPPDNNRLPGEFDLIARYFKPLAANMPGALGLDDDVCTWAPALGEELVLTADALVAGIHFLPEDPADLVARKMLRVNLSDLAAKGARPVGYLMVTAFSPDVDEAWVATFCEGLAADQAEFGIGLMGGDTVATPGPLTLSLTAIGTVPAGKAPRRNGARPGDAVLVSGSIGDGALGLKVLRNEFPGLDETSRRYLTNRYHLPQPRVDLGRALMESGRVHAMMDVSDGLVADLAHIADASHVATTLRANAVPVSEAAAAILADDMTRLPLILTGGDDYELLLTASPDAVPDLLGIAAELDMRLTIVGEIAPGQGVTVVDRDGAALELASKGYRHF